MAHETKLTIRLSKELHDAVREKTDANDVTLSQVIRWYLRAWSQGEAPIYLPGYSKESVKTE